MRTRLSIIIPVFGVEQYIARCLDSVFSINVPEDEYEVICVDDCSKDASVKIIEEYQPQHPNLVLVHHEENKRQGGARNTGIIHAKGEYMLFVDADDMLPKYDLVGLLDYMGIQQLDLLLCAAECQKNDGEVRRWGNAPITESPIMSGPALFTDEYIHNVAFGVVWIGVYKTELVRRVDPFVEKVPYEDADWTLRCAYHAKRVQYKPVVIYHYMDNPSSTTRKSSVDSAIYRAKQSLRVWSWAQTANENHEQVMLSAEDFCTWNLSAVKSLWKYGFLERRRFYQSFTQEEFSIMKTWRGDYGYMDLVRHPALSQIVLSVVSPVLRVGKWLKGKI
jgi:glycosyltransferase involved in cell wall biosynthesis